MEVLSISVFVLVAVFIYLGCVLALMLQLRSSRIAAKGYAAPDFFTFQGSLRLMGFLFSGQHLRLDDAAVSKLVWGVRAMLVVCLTLITLDIYLTGMAA